MSIDSVPDIAYDGEAKVETDPDVAVLTTSPASQSLYSPAILAFVPNHDKSLLQRLWYVYCFCRLFMFSLLLRKHSQTYLRVLLTSTIG